jgi:MFS family permease
LTTAAVDVRDTRWMAVMVLGAVSLINGLAETIVSPPLSAVEQRYAASPSAVAWLVSGYLIAGAVAIPLAGRLGDQFGRRRGLLVSLGIFAAGALVCAVSHSIGVLIAGRLITGFGAGVGPLGLALSPRRDRSARSTCSAPRCCSPG